MDHIGTREKEIEQAAAILRDGGLIAFPTETYYGLAVDPFNESSLKRLFAVKNRPSIKPVLVLIPSRKDISRMSHAVPEAAEPLMNRFWPGPLTMVFPARRELSLMLTGNTGTIGVRLSSNPVAQALLQVFGGPLTATSANRSGGKAAVTEDEVREIFGGAIDMVLSGGRTPGGKPSTLIGFAGDRVDCIREGCIACSEIAEVVLTGD
ncbi:MAG: L-threonylcarbamoyladenylate synthase [Desulfobulbaceae bacterium]|nr:L-threonylcarbamoyladenylate synthase [Desulfobulbaceae bacterium]